MRDHRRGQRPSEKGQLARPNPVSRGKAGSKIHVIPNAVGYLGGGDQCYEHQRLP